MKHNKLTNVIAVKPLMLGLVIADPVIAVGKTHARSDTRMKNYPYRNAPIEKPTEAIK